MRIIYDSKKPTNERVQVFGNDGNPINCGCFWIQIETTNMVTGKGQESLNIKRWGTIKKRNEIHSKVASGATSEETT